MGPTVFISREKEMGVRLSFDFTSDASNTKLADMYVLVFDTTNPYSLTYLDQWKRMLKDKPCLVLGTKCDLNGITLQDDIDRFVSEFSNVTYANVSASTRRIDTIIRKFAHSALPMKYSNTTVDFGDSSEWTLDKRKIAMVTQRKKSKKIRFSKRGSSKKKARASVSEQTEESSQPNVLGLGLGVATEPVSISRRSKSFRASFLGDSKQNKQHKLKGM